MQQSEEKEGVPQTDPRRFEAPPFVHGHAISDATGGPGGAGVALLYSNGLSFMYVNTDGTTHLGPSSVFAHTFADGDVMNIMNFNGSFGVSLYSAASHSTQTAASGCQ